MQRERETIAAPVAGTIYSVKATRGPVQAGEVALDSSKRRFLLEVKVLNRDIGFIHEGQPRSKWRLSRFKNLALLMVRWLKLANAIVDKE